VLIVGAGGLGGITAALMTQRGGADVFALTTNAAIATAIRSHGYRVTGQAVDAAVVRGQVLEALGPEVAPFDVVVLAVQPPQVEEAARSVTAHLSPGARVVCFQNGLCEERVERIVGGGRVVGAVVAWGGSMPSPGEYVRTARGGFTVGRPDGRIDAELERVADLLSAVGPVKTTMNLAGARWSKLAINCAISTLGTLGGATLGAVLLHRSARRLALEIMTEAVAVSRRLGVTLDKIGGVDLEWLALTEGERWASGSPSLLAKHSVLLATGARYRRMRSSMLAAIERGRPPAVDFLNGEIVTRAAALGLEAPVNAEAQRMVHELAHRRLAPGISAIYTLRDRLAASRAA